MFKRTLHHFSVSALIVATTSVGFAQITEPPKSLPVKAAAKKKSASRPQLPAFKAKRRQSEESKTPTVVVRTAPAETPNLSESVVKPSVVSPAQESEVVEPIKTSVPNNKAAEEKITVNVKPEVAPPPQVSALAQSPMAPTPTPSAVSPEVSVKMADAAPTKIAVTETTEPALPVPSPSTQTTSGSIAVSLPTQSSTQAFRPRPRLFIKSSYLNAQYSRLEGDLENGATSLSLGLGRRSGNAELRGSIEIGHGRDQSMSLQNTRFVVLRGDYSYFFPQGRFTPFINGGVGFGDFNVRSLRSSTGGDLVVREHIHTKALTLSPGAGVRFYLKPTFMPSPLSLDAMVEYTALIGTQQSSALGGLSASLALGFAF